MFYIIYTLRPSKEDVVALKEKSGESSIDMGLPPLAVALDV